MGLDSADGAGATACVGRGTGDEAGAGVDGSGDFGGGAGGVEDDSTGGAAAGGVVELEVEDDSGAWVCGTRPLYIVVVDTG